MLKILGGTLKKPLALFRKSKSSLGFFRVGLSLLIQLKSHAKGRLFAGFKQAALSLPQLQLVFFILFTLAFGSCQKRNDYSPKPHGYARIDLPASSYKPLATSHPYQFEMSTAAIELPDRDKYAKPHWIILNYPSLNATIQLTYYPINKDLGKLQQIVNDTYKLTARHQVRASSIDEQRFKSKNGHEAIFLHLEGNVPTSLNFFTTDTTNHFLRGAVYFKQAGKADSLRPIINHLQKDVEHLLNTLKYR